MIDDVTPTDPSIDLLTISDFARLARLTTKALRIYDEAGLLRPVEVDRSNGYRRYALRQLRTAQLIALLRGADMSLAEIAALLTELEVDRDLAVQRFGRHASAMEARHASRRDLVRHIHTILREDDNPMFPIDTRYVPAQRVMSMQRRLRAPDTAAFVAEAKSAFAHHLRGEKATGPFTLIFHGVVDYESDGPLEAIVGCPDDVLATDVMGIRTEPAHDEAFTTITKAQWDFPAILTAYDAVACSQEVLARPHSRLSCREVYLTEPDAIGDDEAICDIAFPLG